MCLLPLIESLSQRRHGKTDKMLGAGWMRREAGKYPDLDKLKHKMEEIVALL